MNIGKRNRLARIILLLLLFLTPGVQHCFAQTIISGTVSSAKDKQPVAGAFIYAYGGDSLYGYAFSDENGSFSKGAVLTLQSIAFLPFESLFGFVFCTVRLSIVIVS